MSRVQELRDQMQARYGQTLRKFTVQNNTIKPKVIKPKIIKSSVNKPATKPLSDPLSKKL